MDGMVDDGSPLYLQISKHIRAQIIAGLLAPGDRLPSVREAADSYRVNPNTMHRAMVELERDRVIHSNRGIGFFVTDDTDLMRRLRQAEAEGIVARCLTDLQALGLDPTTIQSLLLDQLKGERP